MTGPGAADSAADGGAPLRVVYVIPGLGTGGAERSLSELLEHGLKGAVDARVVCLHRRAEGVQQRVTGLHTVPVHWLSARRLPGRVRELRALLRADPPDLVVTQVYEADIVGRLALLGRRRPRLLSTLVNSQYDPVRAREDRNVSRVGMAATQVIDAVTGRLRADHYLALTQAVADHAARHLRIAPGRITVVPRGRRRAYLGEPGAERRAAVRRRLDIPDDRKVLISVGRREYQKGQRYLLEALPRVLEAHPDTLLLVAGRDGNATADLDRITADLGLTDHVRYLGHDDDVPGLMAAADVFVFPSLWEGFGGALGEALGLALPVVVSDLPELREVLGPQQPPTGVVVPAADPPALARALIDLLGDPERRAALSRAGRIRFDQNFELEAIAGPTLALYRRTIG
ncbi:MAG: glycosyltransferase [Acidimicrobiales bacterium]|nr:glycosyltransferase [Acidimicrobiales bacterium]